MREEVFPKDSSPPGEGLQKLISLTSDGEKMRELVKIAAPFFRAA
jgi:hypothetical protein